MELKCHQKLWQKKERNKVNWRDQRDKFGKIKGGQVWQKIDNGMVMRVVGKTGGSRWKVAYKNGGRRGVTHTMDERMIYHYFNKLL